MRPRPVRRAVALLAAGAVLGAVLPVVGAGVVPASAAPLETLSADPLPTWQTNGTVWALEHVGGQSHAYSHDEFRERYVETYGGTCPF